MKNLRHALQFLAAALLGSALFFSCQQPIDGPDNHGTQPSGEIPVKSIKLDISARELLTGETVQLTATLMPEDATNKDEHSLVWNSSAPGVAKVSDKGLVTAVGEGSATISVSFSADIRATCEVTVKNPSHASGVVNDGDFGLQGESSDEDREAGLDLSYQFAPRAALASDEAANALSDVSVEGSVYSFTLPATKDPFYGNSSCLQNDDIIVFRSCEAFPDGAAIKIESSTANYLNGQAEEYRYYGHLVSIEEVFKNMHLETAELPLGEVRRIVDEEGREVKYAPTKGGAGFDITIPELFGDNFTASLNLGQNLSITPKMRIGFNMDIAADVVDFNLTYARCRVEASADLSCDLTFKAPVEKKFRTKRLTVFLGAIPVGPIVISPTITMDFEVKLTGQVDLTLSLSYQKGVYAHAFYNGSTLQCRVGETTPADTRDPFAVSGNLSGAVEFGPNLGMGVSLYGGALALGVDFDPHMVFTVFSSYPISLEGLQNIGNGTFWLANAGYEPSLAFSFGGYIQAGYAWSMDFEVPEELGLSYSFGKTYIVPQVDGPIECVPERTATTFTTHIKNKAMFDGNMYMKVREADDPSGNWKTVPLTTSDTPNNETPVEANAVFSPMVPFQRYEAIGPFMKISIFGIEVEVEMVRNYSHYFYTVDEKTDRAVRALLADIYACGDGNWEGCNWMDPNVPFSELVNIWFKYDSDQEAALYAGNEDYCRKKLSITVPDTWKMDNQLRIGRCTAELDDLIWSLDILGGVIFDSIEIEDPNFEEAFGNDTDEFGYFHDIWPVRSRLVIHSKRFDKGTRGHQAFQLPLISSNTDLYVDLSGTAIAELITYCGDLSLSGTVLLDNCPLLNKIWIKGTQMPEKLSYRNCPKMYEVRIIEVPGTFDLSKYAGKCEYMRIEGESGAFSFGKDCSMDKLYMTGYATCAGLSLDGTKVKEVYSDGVLGEFTATGIDSLSSVIFSKGARHVDISACPALSELRISSSGVDTNGDGWINIWDGPLESISVSGTTRLKSVYIASSYVSGTLPSWIQSAEYASYPYKYSYAYDENLERIVPSVTHPNGYTMPGEPGRPYRHCLGGYYED